MDTECLTAFDVQVVNFQTFGVQVSSSVALGYGKSVIGPNSTPRLNSKAADPKEAIRIYSESNP